MTTPELGKPLTGEDLGSFSQAKIPTVQADGSVVVTDESWPDTALAKIIYAHFTDFEGLHPDEAGDSTGALLYSLQQIGVVGSMPEPGNGVRVADAATTAAEPGTVGTKAEGRSEPKTPAGDVAGAREDVAHLLRDHRGGFKTSELDRARADQIIGIILSDYDRLRGALETAAVWLTDLADVVETPNARVSAKNRKWKGDLAREWARRCRDALTARKEAEHG